MRTDREIALKLRISGRSYNQINKALGVPKSTLSGWFTGLVISDEARKRIETRARKKSLAGLVRRNKNQTRLAQLRARETRKTAAREVRPLSNKTILILGAALYWAEGYKKPIVRNGKILTHHAVSLTNSDPALVRAFLKFLREYCGVPEEKIKAGIRIFPHQNRVHIERYWQQLTSIKLENFQKSRHTISRSSLGKKPFNQLPHGVIQVQVNDTKLYHRIMGYIEGIKKHI